MIEAARYRLTDVSIAEWAVTDTAMWHEMAQAVTSWRMGKEARRETQKPGPPDVSPAES